MIQGSARSTGFMEERRSTSTRILSIRTARISISTIHTITSRNSSTSRSPSSRITMTRVITTATAMTMAMTTDTGMDTYTAMATTDTTTKDTTTKDTTTKDTTITDTTITDTTIMSMIMDTTITITTLVQRFEILFGLFNGIFLLFIGMNMLKESLEHLMLEDDHHGGNDHGPVVRVPLFWTVIALGATLVSSLGYQNHNQFCLLLNTSSLSSTQAAFARSNSSKLSSLARNQFTLTSLACVVGVILVAMFPRIDALDKVVAIGQSLVMFSLGGPLTKVLGMILLQTTPPKALEGVEEVVRQLSAANPAIVRLERAHVWTNTYGQLIGTAVVSVDKGADEQGILASIHQRLQGFLDLDAQSEGTGELTVQLVQSH
ncbi:hypothetical protein BGZ54_000298 [Gamsiella multidivaricata]|nr:hypothetical protein BGZ54_000298 [Gamsiella multidivaricata]